MGLGIPKTKRDVVMANARALEKQRGGRRFAAADGVVRRQLAESPSVRHIVWPGAGHHAIGDAPALIRSNATGLIIPFVHDTLLCPANTARTAMGRSAVQVSTSVLTHMLESNPLFVDIYFDLANRQRYPPQREAVAVQRQARCKSDNSVIATLVKQFNCASVTDVIALDVGHMPLLESKFIDWAAVFNVPALKSWAWLVFQNALRVAAVRAIAKLKHNNVTCRIWCTDGATLHTITKASSATSIVHPETDFGEADLRVFFSAAQASINGAHVVIHTIDTDFMVMALAAVWFLPVTTVLLRLKLDVYNVRDIINLAGTTKTDRLNAAFWMLSLGSDYSNPLTNNGFMSKELCSFITSNCNGPYTLTSSTVATFTAAHALEILRSAKRVNKKKAPPKELIVTLHDMHFCVQYYGFLFDTSTAAYPKTPDNTVEAHSCQLVPTAL